VLETSRLFLEFVTSEGVWRLVGELRFLGTAPQNTDQFGVYDVARFTCAGPAMLLQRREFIRSPYTAAINVVPVRADAIAVSCETLNVSGGGLLLRGVTGVEVGDVLDFQLSPLDGDAMPIRGRCEVVRSAGDGDVGVRFTSIDELDRDRLIAFAYQRELAERERRLAA